MVKLSDNNNVEIQRHVQMETQPNRESNISQTLNSFNEYPIVVMGSDETMQSFDQYMINSLAPKPIHEQPNFNLQQLDSNYHDRQNSIQ